MKRMRTRRSSCRLTDQPLNVGAGNLGTGDLGAARTPPLEADRQPHHDHGVPHQFDNAEQQHDAAELGMWAFLATEVLFFGVLFVSFAVYRHAYHDVFAL